MLDSDWNLWKCPGMNHKMMIFESMDVDTEVRRLTPLALIANPGMYTSVIYINLIIGYPTAK